MSRPAFPSGGPYLNTSRGICNAVEATRATFGNDAMFG